MRRRRKHPHRIKPRRLRRLSRSRPRPCRLPSTSACLQPSRNCRCLPSSQRRRRLSPRHRPPSHRRSPCPPRHRSHPRRPSRPTMRIRLRRCPPKSFRLLPPAQRKIPARPRRRRNRAHRPRSTRLSRLRPPLPSTLIRQPPWRTPTRSNRPPMSSARLALPQDPGPGLGARIRPTRSGRASRMSRPPTNSVESLTLPVAVGTTSAVGVRRPRLVSTARLVLATRRRRSVR